MTVIFREMLGDTGECYVDDLVMKLQQRVDYLEHMRMEFDKLRQHRLKMNQLKCAFEVTSGKFLGFVVCHSGTEVDPMKIKVIKELLPPTNIRELSGFQGHFTYIREFISKL